MAKIIFNQFVDLKHCWNYPNKKNSMLFKLKETSKGRNIPRSTVVSPKQNVNTNQTSRGRNNPR